MNEKIAIIDLGSNTARLVALSYQPETCFKLEDELREPVRLSENMGESKIIRAEAAKRGIDALKAFKTYCDAVGISKIHATATSAVREAVNGASFLAAVEKSVGLKPEILAGEKEAYYGTLAVANSLNYQDALVLDLGGGSLQLSYMKNRKFKSGQSWPLGAVRSTELFFADEIVKKKEAKELIKKTSESIAEYLEDVPKGLPIIGMGGTVRNLANIAKKANGDRLELIHNYHFSLNDLDKITEGLITKTVAERKKITGLNSDRADIITAGAIVIREVLDYYQAKEIIISGQGIREGLFYSYLFPKNDHLVKDLRSFSINNLAKRYYDFPKHNKHVRKLSLLLFEQLAPLHGYGDWERDLLAQAAIVHDIGMAINYYDHHKQGQMLVIGSALAGFSHREQAIISLLVRFHRKGKPSALGLDSVLEKGDLERLSKLAALLRLAEYLERSKAQRVQDLRCHIAEQYLQIEVLAEDDVSVEIKEAILHSDLLANAYGVEVEIVLGH